MKRLLALGALLLAASACATTGNTNTQTANVSATPAATPAGVTNDEMIAKERQTWDWIKAKDWATMSAAVADDFVFVDAQGVHDKAASQEILKKLDVTEFTLSDFKVVKADADLYVVTHNAVLKGSFDGQALPGKPERVATAWVNRGGKWLIIYHQDNAAEEPQPTPTPGGANANTASPNSNTAANSNAAPAASPQSSPPVVPATASDAERQVWEALKRKDWETFAAFLPPDALEVEPEGVYTKEQSLEGVNMVPFANATLSEMKEVRIDADAALVTYLVKSTDRGWPPAGMRHSTIWVNRAGRWLAPFHMGTVAATPGK